MPCSTARLLLSLAFLCLYLPCLLGCQEGLSTPTKSSETKVVQGQTTPTGLVVKAMESEAFSINLELAANCAGRVRISLREARIQKPDVSLGNGDLGGRRISMSGTGYSDCEFTIGEDDGAVQFSLRLNEQTGADVLDGEVALLFGKEQATAIRTAVPGADTKVLCRLDAELAGTTEGKPWVWSLPSWQQVAMNTLASKHMGCREEARVTSRKCFEVGYLVLGAQRQELVQANYTANEPTLAIRTGASQLATKEFSGQCLILEITWQSVQ